MDIRQGLHTAPPSAPGLTWTWRGRTPHQRPRPHPYPQDNLESQTYETFEKDVTKYALYEEAVHKALLDRPAPPGQPDKHVVLMVVGAGRGPLVRAAMQAAARASRRLRVYAVEKNPNAVVHIQQLLAEHGWQDQVRLLPCVFPGMGAGGGGVERGGRVWGKAWQCPMAASGSAGLPCACAGRQCACRQGCSQVTLGQRAGWRRGQSSGRLGRPQPDLCILAAGQGQL